jgi:hypothetical protein
VLWCAEGPRREHEVLFAKRQGQTAHDAAGRRPAEQTDAQNDREHARANHRDDRDDHDQRRKRHHDVRGAHHDGVGPSTVVAGDRTEQQADAGRDQRGHEADRQRHLAREQQAAEHVPAGGVRAERMAVGWGLAERRQVDPERVGRRNQWSGEGRERDQADDDQPKHRQSMTEEPPYGHTRRRANRSDHLTGESGRRRREGCSAHCKRILGSTTA